MITPLPMLYYGQKWSASVRVAIEIALTDEERAYGPRAL